MKVNKTMRVEDIFKIVSEERGYREIMYIFYNYIKTGEDFKELERVIRNFTKYKEEIAKEHMTRMVKWVGDKDNLGLTEGLVKNKGITRDKSARGEVSKYIIVDYYTDRDKQVVIGAVHKDSKEEVKRVLEEDIKIGYRLIEDKYIIDTESECILEYIVVINRDREIEVKFIEKN